MVTVDDASLDQIPHLIVEIVRRQQSRYVMLVSNTHTAVPVGVAMPMKSLFHMLIRHNELRVAASQDKPLGALSPVVEREERRRHRSLPPAEGIPPGALQNGGCGQIWIPSLNVSC